uniref:Hydroxyproline-rich glycoprotein family protein n=1 Tax=Kalanchoe fedtschenkoi TaxID=63787 RepID=A0A7N0URK5_KALFE
MESSVPDYSPPSHMDASRPSLGFPLGTALLLIIIFSLSGVFSCCYHWDKVRSLRRSYWDDDEDDLDDVESGGRTSPVKPKHLQKSEKAEEKESFRAVVMPGDQIAKFVAMPCPCRPPRALPEKKVVAQDQKPSKPPRMAVPLY